MSPGPRHETGFDTYASTYDEALSRGLSVSGEDKEFFVRGRINWLAGRLRERQLRPLAIMDFGCGTGSSTPALNEILAAESVVGVDVSAESLNEARRTFRSALDLAFCNGVFHHIPVSERADAVRYVLGTDYLFIFPRALRAVRSLEPFLARFPFGAQYQILCRKPLAG